ncbi:MAG: insulinase family protein [Chromatiales bacterium]|nr:MAG: insulinase family protein [Chromatiales bacterium]
MRRVLLGVLTLLASAAWSDDITLPDYERVVLENGTVLLLSEKHEVPLIGLRAEVRGGSVADPVGKAGVAELLASVMQKGAGGRDAAAFASATANVGGRLTVSADVDSISVAAEFLSRDAELMIELVSDVLQEPTLAADELEKEQARAIGLIKAAKDGDPNALMANYAYAFIFGDHPYGRPTSGSEMSLADVSRDDLLTYYSENFGGDRLIISVVGDFDTAAMKARLTAEFGSWEPAAGALEEVPAPPKATGGRVLLIDKPGATQSYFWFGNVGVALDYPRRAELNLANTVFGARFTSMLVTELRVNAGLTYRARSVVDQRTQPGPVTVRSFTETSTTVEAIDLAISVLRRLQDKGLDDDMMVSARNYIMGQFPPRLETASSLARMLAFLELNGLDRSYIDEYGSELQAAAAESVALAISEVYPQPDDLVFVIIGDAATIRDEVAKYGEVTEMSITEPSFRVPPAD